jgi:hypothetical protein
MMFLHRQFCEVCNCIEPGGKSRRCITCRQLIVQASNTGTTGKRQPIRAAEAIAAIRASGQLGKELYSDRTIAYVCQYTEIPLATDKKLSIRGDYASFDHVIPNDPSRAALCSRIINDFKGLVTDVEFSRFVCNVLDVSAPRRLHGLSIQQTESFLTALQAVMRRDETEILQARRKLMELSSIVRFARDRLETPGEAVAPTPQTTKNPETLKRPGVHNKVN